MAMTQMTTKPQEKSMYTEEAAVLAEQCSGWYEGRSGEEMAQYIAGEIRARIVRVENRVALIETREKEGFDGNK